jgi:hypothetical protein
MYRMYRTLRTLTKKKSITASLKEGRSGSVLPVRKRSNTFERSSCTRLSGLILDEAKISLQFRGGANTMQMQKN